MTHPSSNPTLLLLLLLPTLIVCMYTPQSSPGRYAPGVAHLTSATLALSHAHPLHNPSNHPLDSLSPHVWANHSSVRHTHPRLLHFKLPIPETLQHTIRTALRLRNGHHIPWLSPGVLRFAHSLRLDPSRGPLRDLLTHPRLIGSQPLPLSAKLDPILLDLHHTTQSDHAHHIHDYPNHLHLLIHPVAHRVPSGLADALVHRMTALLPAPVSAHIVPGSRKLVLTIQQPTHDHSALQTALHHIAAHPDVLVAQPRLRMSLHNKWAHWVTQSNRQDASPFWDAGIQGQGEVVGCSDTGVDYDSCYFSDPAVAVPVNTVNQNHRKLVMYRTRYADGGDYAAGHGTHVVGSIAADALSASASAAEYNGMAPKARVAFTDICTDRCTSGLSVPSDLNTQLFPDHRNAGARIDTNSWGSNLNSYTSTAQDIDEFTHAYPDYAVLVAAGNTGSRGYFSVSSPATAKNCIAVGASYNALQSLGYRVVRVDVPSSHPSPLAFMSDFTEQPTGVNDKLVLNASLATTVPPDACSPLPAASLTGKVALIDRGTCFFVDKIKHAQDAGARAVVIVNNENSPVFAMGGSAPSLTIPSCMISLADGNALKALPDAYVSLGPTLTPSADSVAQLHFTDNLASFSSRGPTADSRIKPDLVAPGYRVASVRADGSVTSPSCSEDPLTISGTSMASPIAAGSLALIRQYFRMGYHTQPPTPRDISGVLLKALAISSAQTMAGGTIAPPRESAAPSFEQGFGRIQLDRVLPLNGSTWDRGLRVLVYDTHDQNGLQSNDVHRTYIRVHPQPTNASSDDFPLTVTLTWYDPPAQLGSAWTLVNNLDLHLQGPDGSVYVGNHRERNAENLACPQATADDANNVERIVVPTPAPGLYTIIVQGTNVAQGPQRFAMAVSGRVSAEAAGPTACAYNCSSHGQCTDQGVCQCSYGWTGFDCSREIVPMEPSQHYTGTVRCGQWTYHRFHVDANLTGDVNILLTAHTGDPDIYVRKQLVPTIQQHTWAEISCDLPGICVSGRTHTLKLGQVSNGDYIVGVHGYVSDIYEARYTIWWLVASPGDNDDGGGSNSGDDSGNKAPPSTPALDNDMIIALAVSIPGAFAILLYALTIGIRRLRNDGWFSAIRRSRQVTGAFMQLDEVDAQPEADVDDDAQAQGVGSGQHIVDDEPARV